MRKNKSTLQVYESILTHNDNKKNRIVGKNNILDFNVNFVHISEAMRHIKVIIPKQDDIV